VITYVDTSTLLKLIIDEQGSDRAALIWSSADAVASVTLITVEARAAIAAAARGRRLTAIQARDAVGELDALLRVLYLMPVTDELVAAAAELAAVEGLRGCRCRRYALSGWSGGAEQYGSYGRVAVRDSPSDGASNPRSSRPAACPQHVSR
jgi:predicted nucleic acid-binding protein